MIAEIFSIMTPCVIVVYSLHRQEINKLIGKVQEKRHDSSTAEAVF